MRALVQVPKKEIERKAEKLRHKRRMRTAETLRSERG
jgi:hypothetical protein